MDRYFILLSTVSPAIHDLHDIADLLAYQQISAAIMLKERCDDDKERPEYPYSHGRGADLRPSWRARRRRGWPEIH